MTRREMLFFSMLSAGVALRAPIAQAQNNASGGVFSDSVVRAYLKSIIPSRESIDTFLAGRQGPEQLSRHEGWKYDAELGWVHCDVVRSNSIGRTKGYYSYERDGARKVTNSAGENCRIHSYGNSFTHCDQVSDGETWQEFLASHIREPIRNYGVGGYGVYQAYRRMLRVEQERSAEYIIFNIWSDDHYRSLDAWRSIRFGQGSNCGFTLPHLRVDVANDKCEERENILSQADDVYKLLDEDYLFETFRDDPILKMVLSARSDSAASGKLSKPVAVNFGIPDELIADTPMAERIIKIHTEAALYATTKVLEWTEKFATDNGKKLMVILSFDRENVALDLAGKPRFDQTLVDWLEDKPYPVVDMREPFKREYANYKGDIDSFLKPYYIGHHTPLGNYFFARALRESIIPWLEPKPRPYR